jgi:hypothetical protein
VNKALSVAVSLAFVFSGLALALMPDVPYAAAQTSTSTIIGWLVPDSSHFSNSLLITIFPLMGMVILVTMLMVFHRKGDIVVYFALGGLLAGSLFADVGTGSSSTPGVPFADILVCGLLIFLYWWNS